MLRSHWYLLGLYPSVNTAGWPAYSVGLLRPFPGDGDAGTRNSFAFCKDPGKSQRQLAVLCFAIILMP
jgi:hypothetical protein